MKDEIFKALADPARRKILELLGEGDMAAGDISSHFDITKPSVSRHLAVLKSSGLVSAKKSGQKIIYSLETGAVREIMRWLYNSFGNVWIKR